uniref:Uncharacterized protein n=1 Tax=Helianthus annuus TaxID=4232 RepID=A0A251V4F9_HELAN
MNAFMATHDASSQLTKFEDSVDVTIIVDYEFSAPKFFDFIEGKTAFGDPFDVPAKRTLASCMLFLCQDSPPQGCD